MMSKHKIRYWTFLLLIVFSLFSCANEEEVQLLRNDCLKRSLGPNVVGNEIAFVYAMAIPYGMGNIVSAQVDASLKGADGTWMENNSYHTDGSGVDVPVPIADTFVNKASRTEVDFTVDTCAAALRYYYVIPEEAKGKEVSFTFSATSDNGETVSYEMGPYSVTNLEIARGIDIQSDLFISVQDMAVYSRSEAEKIPDKIDIIYLYRSISGVSYGHSLIAPSADKQFMPEFELPKGVANTTRLRKEWGSIDTHLLVDLADDQGTYIDEVDLKEIDLSTMPDYALNLKSKGGVWVETGDGKYRAFIYVNKALPSGSVISIKRLQMY